VINCAALPEDTLEIELFGSEKEVKPGTLSQKKGGLNWRKAVRYLSMK